MKKLVILMCVVTMLFTSCSNTTDDVVIPAEKGTVTLRFSPYTMSSMTRADDLTKLSTWCKHLDIWIINGTDTIGIHKSSDLATVSVDLDMTKTYRLYAIAHRCDDDATLANNVISFPENKITHSFFYTTTFSPGTSTSLNCVMQRIVGKFVMTTTDVVPNEVAKFYYTITETNTKYNVTSGGINKESRSGTINLTNKNNDGTASINIYVINDNNDDTQDYTITISALTETDDIVETRTFTDVTMKNNYVTTYRGTFFVTTEMSIGFSCTDWSFFDIVDF